jgi:ATP-dependent DNA ligase
VTDARTRERLRNVPADPMEWRPQEPLPTRSPVTITDPIVEPMWTGVRALLHFDSTADEDERVVLTDSEGAEIDPTDEAVVPALRVAINAHDAVLDGVLTWEASRTDEGTALITESSASVTSMFLGRDHGVDVRRKDDSEGDTLAFVATDLLRIDGQPLLDVPLLERKRLLESVVTQSERVRVSVYARPPIDVWLGTWKAAGFAGAYLKAANSRYIPGGYSEQWRAVTRIAERK